MTSFLESSGFDPSFDPGQIAALFKIMQKRRIKENFKFKSHKYYTKSWHIKKRVFVCETVGSREAKQSVKETKVVFTF